MTEINPLDRVFAQISRTKLAREIGLTRQAVCAWTRIPPERLRAVSRVTGIPIDELVPPEEAAE